MTSLFLIVAKMSPTFDLRYIHPDICIASVLLTNHNRWRHKIT